MQSFISFVIPVKDDAERLCRCLTSITTNNYPRELIEIIVVDNDSRDGSARVARDFGAVVLHSTASSVAKLRNHGARAALGKIIAFVDSDHEIDGQWILSALDVLSHPAVAATGSAYLPQPRANWVQRLYDGLRRHLVQREDVGWLGSGNFAVKRAPFEQIGGFNASLTACEDVDLCNRLRLEGHRIVEDPTLRSIHFGDPSTLWALFFGELWRGRDNLRVTFRGPFTFRNFRSAIVPIVDLAAIAAGSVAALAGQLGPALVCYSVLLLPAIIRAAVILWRRRWRAEIRALRPRPSALITAAQAMVVALVFDLARAFALVAQGSHHVRRSA